MSDRSCSSLLQGIDWRDSRAQGCNAGRNPIQESFYDGVNADPLEVLFVKVKNSMHAARWQHVLQVRGCGFDMSLSLSVPSDRNVQFSE